MKSVGNFLFQTRKMKLVILVFSIIGVRYLEAEKVEPAYESLLNVMNSVYEYWSQKVAMALWDHVTNITETNRRRLVEVETEHANFEKMIWKSIRNLNWQNISNDDIRRQFKLYSTIGTSALEDEDFTRFTSLVTQMEGIYSTAQVCVDEGSNSCKNSSVSELLYYQANSVNPSLLKQVWTKWSDTVGPQIKPLYTEYVELSNKAARLNGFEDTSEMWLQSYEDETFLSQIEELWMQVRPLYMEMHAFRRWQLKNHFGEIVSETGPIPGHLLDMRVVQSKSSELNLTGNYPNQLVRQNYTAKKMFETAEDFFTSINMTAMPETFWNGSILEKPRDREMLCAPGSLDFYDGLNFRIMQCTSITFGSLYSIHHEMGHIEYYLQYKDQPVRFREGANHGFQEAIGETIALSVKTSTHLRKIGLLNIPDDEGQLLNNLFDTALDKVAYLPVFYLVDLWRWKVFRGEIKPENYNCNWWELKEQYEGTEPPVERSEEDFDPALVFHIIADVPYIRYFVGTILQFQFHKALCTKAGQYDPGDPEKPLHKCDIYGSAEAGNALKKMLAMGSSKPWPDALEVLTGERNMSASALLEYFKPLHEWLRAENIKNNVSVGWEKSKKVCHSKKSNKSEVLPNSTISQPSANRPNITTPQIDVMPQPITTTTQLPVTIPLNQGDNNDSINCPEEVGLIEARRTTSPG